MCQVIVCLVIDQIRFNTYKFSDVVTCMDRILVTGSNRKCGGMKIVITKPFTITIHVSKMGNDELN